MDLRHEDGTIVGNGQLGCGEGWGENVNEDRQVDVEDLLAVAAAQGHAELELDIFSGIVLGIATAWGTLRRRHTAQFSHPAGRDCGARTVLSDHL